MNRLELLENLHKQNEIGEAMTRIANTFYEPINDANNDEEKKFLLDMMKKEQDREYQSRKLHDLSMKNYTLRFIIDQYPDDFPEGGWFPERKDWNRYKECIGRVLFDAENKMENWLPEKNCWADKYNYSVVGMEDGLDGYMKITAECHFARIEYLDPSLFLRYLLDIYSTIFDTVSEINNADGQHFKITVKGQICNEWWNMEEWPKEEGHWRTLHRA